MAIKVHREGEMNDGGPLTVLNTGRPYAIRNLVILTHMEPRGFGESRHTITIDTESFPALAQMMMHANPEAAMKAFGSALQAGTPKPIEDAKCWYPDYGYSN
jgi:hypothetical protein